ncbi:hypothetical protein I7I48_12152 [Histoplasma ohiense]|nr:hypothetical protein I7I48_12152 [Histoplasma ohiense (nom. inval.)]
MHSMTIDGKTSHGLFPLQIRTNPGRSSSSSGSQIRRRTNQKWPKKKKKQSSTLNRLKFLPVGTNESQPKPLTSQVICTLFLDSDPARKWLTVSVSTVGASSSKRLQAAMIHQWLLPPSESLRRGQAHKDSCWKHSLSFDLRAHHGVKSKERRTTGVYYVILFCLPSLSVL